MKQLLRTSAVISAGSSGTAVLSLLQSAAIARFLGVSAFGAWSLLTTLFATVVALAGFRIAEPLTRYIVEFKAAEDLDGVRQVFSAATFTELTTLCAGAVLGLMIAFILGGAYTAAGPGALLVYALSLPGAALSPVLFAAARDARRMAVPITLTLSVEALRLFMVMIAGATGFASVGIIASVWLVTAVMQAACSAVLLDVILRDHYGFRIRGLVGAGIFAPRLAGFWSFMRKNFAASSVSSVLKNGDLLVLGTMQGPETVGLFRVAKSVSALLQMISAPIGSAFYQDINECLQTGNRKAVRQLIRRISMLIGPPIVLAALLTAFFASDIVSLIYGDPFRQAAPLLAVLLIGTCVLSLLFWAHPAILALDRSGSYLLTLALITAAGLPGYFVAARLGPLSLAWTVTLAWVTLYALLALRVWRALRADGRAVPRIDDARRERAQGQP